MSYRICCFVFLILWWFGAFSGSETATPAIGMFSCLSMDKLEDIHRDIKKLKEGEE